MPCPRPQHVVALHTAEPCVDVNPGSGESVPDVKRPIHVRVGECHEYFLLFRVGVGFEQAAGFPSATPFFFDFAVGAHKTEVAKSNLLSVTLVLIVLFT
jgi:hypothetical protein